MNLHENAVSTPLWRDPRALTLALAAVLVIMANVTISPALPGLEAMFASDPDARLWTGLLVPAPSIAVVLAAPLAGLAVDRWGRRRLLISGLLLFVISGPAGLYLPDLATIFASRLVLGVAVAMIMSAQTALIGDYFQGDRRSGMVGLQISARNFGGMICVALAGVIAALSPRAPFALYGLALFFLPLVWLTIRDAGPKAADRAAPIKAASVEPRQSWLGAVITIAGLQAVTAMLFFLNPTQTPFFFDHLGYDSAATTGLYLGALTFSGGCVALMFGRVKARLGYGGAYALGYALMAAGFLALSMGEQPIWLPAASLMIGAGYAVVTPIFTALALHLAPAHRRGFAGGLMMTAMALGQFASPFASVPAIAAFGFVSVFEIIAAAFAAIALAAGITAAIRGRSATNMA
ncbi:MFS transporter [uncultured Hoeflea sp.]|uniref:MFS transporter n=1 Tax=uncultured Hoeflea sp. TaxID=538666 RepID=UPI00262A29AB|nr:MFS transporter [uncultured Hoeflea sp.]